LIAPR